MEKANCKECGKEMDILRLNNPFPKKYCSRSCRHRSARKNLRGIDTVIASPQQSTFSNQQSSFKADPQSTFIISELTKDRDRWEKSFNDEKAKREKLKEQKEELEKKITEIQNENRIAAIESAKPSGLSGILQSDAGSKLLEMCAPFIQRMMEAQPQQAQPQMTGTDGHQTPAVMFEGWFTKLSMSTRQTVWNMLQAFTIMPDADLKEYAASVVAQITATYPNPNAKAQ